MNWTVFKRRSMNNKWLHEEIPNSLSHKGNANQHDTEIPSCASQNGCQKQNNQPQMLMRMWEKGTLIQCCWECMLVKPL
jgi:hypothetical protein